MRKMLRITACLTACKLGSSVLCEVGTLSPSARRVTRCMRFTAMQQRPRTWFAPLAAENWGCNPALAEPVPGEPDSTRRLRVAIDHSQLITGPVVTYRRAEESWGINAAAHAPHHTPPSSACKCCSQNVLGGTRGTLVVEESGTLVEASSAERRPIAASAVGIDVARGARGRQRFGARRRLARVRGRRRAAERSLSRRRRRVPVES